MKRCLVGFLLITSFSLSAQNADSIAMAELESFFADPDSASVFATLDSLINNMHSPRKSRLMLKTAYIGQISSGSSSSLQQYGWAGGLSYYHKNGLFLDFNNYWNSQYDPNYYLSTTSAGYINYFKSLTYFISYQHYFKNENNTEDIGFGYTDELNGAIFTNQGLLDLGLDYSALFGNIYTEHRINLSANGNFVIKDIGFINSITVLPSFTLTYGNQDVTNYKLGIVWFNGTRRVFINKETTNSFGIMNYGFSCPVSLKIKNLGILLNYQYNIPQALPDETGELENNSFFSASLSYFIEL